MGLCGWTRESLPFQDLGLIPRQEPLACVGPNTLQRGNMGKMTAQVKSLEGSERPWENAGGPRACQSLRGLGSWSASTDSSIKTLGPIR